jgi:acetyltransferase-like isoleucine patch superfamily enzyme
MILLKVFNRLRKCYEQLKFNCLKGQLGYCGKNVYISSKSLICSPNELEIGDNVCIHAFTHIFAGGGLKIGSGSMISSNCSITTVTHPVDSLDRVHTITKSVVIGKNVWIGTGVIILPGVTIGDYAVVGAGAVVTKSIPPMQVFVGNPARFIKHVKLENETNPIWQDE